jgi:putrescine aminotransferase
VNAATGDRQSILTALGHHWNPTAAVMLAAASRQVEAFSSGTRVYGEDGSSSLDFAGSYGVFLVGHGNAVVRDRVLAALRDSPTLIPGTTDPRLTKLVTTLRELLPETMTGFSFGSSGAELVEIALRAVRLARPDRRKIVVVDGGYHGKTLGALRLLGQPHHRIPFVPADDDLVIVPPSDAAAIRRALSARDVAALFVEPVLGGPHLHVHPAGYLTKIAESCAETGTLLVADEIQTGLGRTGKMFGYQHDDVVPDIVLVTKSLTGGMVAVGFAALAEHLLDAARRNPDWDDSLLEGSCISGLAIEAASAAIEQVRTLDLPGRAAELGPRLCGGLADIARRHPKHLLGAPGIGLMAGLRCRNPSVELLVSMQMGARGVHTGHSLNEAVDHPVLRFYPPLTVTAEEIDRMLVALEESMQWLDTRPRRLTDAITWLLRRQYRLPTSLVLKLSHSKLRVDW